jgi:hypothetical protein
MKQSEEHFFTVEEANRTLPLVRRIVEDIVIESERLQELLPRFESVRVADDGTTTSDDLEALRTEVALCSSRLEGYLEELTQVGCLFKGPQGLVDFHSMREGRPVFLCWQLGEEDIRFWHELEGGFAGRQPLEAATTASS